jgi:hypothetical protein
MSVLISHEQTNRTDAMLGDVVSSAVESTDLAAPDLKT